MRLFSQLRCTRSDSTEPYSSWCHSFFSGLPAYPSNGLTCVRSWGTPKIIVQHIVKEHEAWYEERAVIPVLSFRRDSSVDNYRKRKIQWIYKASYPWHYRTIRELCLFKRFGLKQYRITNYRVPHLTVPSFR